MNSLSKANSLIAFVAGFVASTVLFYISWSGHRHILSGRGQGQKCVNPRDANLTSLVWNILKTSNLTSRIVPLIEKPETDSSGSLLVTFDDKSQHAQDNTTFATKLSKEVRVLCWVMTSPTNLQTRAIHVRNTWGKRCNTLLFSSGNATENKDFPTIPVETEEGRAHLTSRTMNTFDYLYAHYLEDADWFLKTDDDTYVIVENLRYLLSDHDPQQPLYFGHHFSPKGLKGVPQGYHSGGAGYVISRETLRRFASRNLSKCESDGGAEDIKFGNCLTTLGVIAGDSRDALNRSRFHCLNINDFLLDRVPDWLRVYDRYGAKLGFESVSDYPITFHYVSSNTMYIMEHYVYHLRPYGVQTALQDLNRHQKVNKQDLLVF